MPDAAPALADALDAVREVQARRSRSADEPDGAGRDGLTLSGVDLSPRALDAHEGEPLRRDGRLGGVDLAEADLAGADLREANLRGANLRGALLRGSDLRSAELGGADLTGTNAEEANAAEVDLAGATLDRAVLNGANLIDAIAEEIRAEGAMLRFTLLDRAAFEDATLDGSDLWGARLDGADLRNASLKRVRLQEASLKGAHLYNVNLTGADLRGADLRGATLDDSDLRGALLEGADLRGASLRGARLQEVDLSETRLQGACVGKAWLERTRMHRGQFGESIGDEAGGDYQEAAQGYLALEHNFDVLGDHEAVSWAYRKRRRMRKRQALQEARLAWRERRWSDAVDGYRTFVLDGLVEAICDYGESVWRVVVTLFFVYCCSFVLYGTTGSVVRVATGEVVGFGSARDLIDLGTFALTSMTSPEGPSVGLAPRDASVHLFTGFQVILSVALTGLLGFVLGNRIRR
jgi:uncharacterized protein YjbI with pentapeptide repeats